MIEGIWQYKITFSDEESTCASIDDFEAKYPSDVLYLQSVFFYDLCRTDAHFH